jgi:hypothetical protein
MSAFERVMRWHNDMVSTQVLATKSMFSAMNIWSGGALSPFASAVEKLCKLYEEQALAPSYNTSAVRQSFTAAVERFVKPITDREQEIMQRQKPDYSNLRAAAEGANSQSIIDNDAYWNQGIQGSNAKSPNRLGTERERTLVDQRLNEVS